MTLTVYEDLEQGTEEWLQARCGVLTASKIGSLITGKRLQVASNDISRALIASLAAEQITGHVEPVHQSADMLRGTLDEPLARDAYADHTGRPVTEVGFMVRTEGHLVVGYSPDGLVGDDGLIEIKSRRQKKHLQTVLADEVPPENMAQIQAGLWVSGRKWCDYISYCGGMRLWIKRVEPDSRWQDAIEKAAANFSELAAGMCHVYEARTREFPIAERIDHFAEPELIL